jgi:hypothetical protein
MEDPEYLSSEYNLRQYFTDYFGNRVKLGTIGTHRVYDDTDYVGMSKSCAMDIADEQMATSVINTEYNFIDWYERQCKYSTLYTSVHIYLFEPYYDTTSMVKDWFRQYYLDTNVER